MPILAWRNDADGFAFANSFTFDATERSTLSAITQPLIAGAAAAIGLVTLNPIVAAAVWAAAQAAVNLGPLPTYGLCGGLTYASLDHWHAKAPLPRGAHRNDQPPRTGPASTAVRDLLWQRLIDSLTEGGVLGRTLEWSLVLNQVPEALGGGAPELKRRTRDEWNMLKAHINAGRPWPLGLIYTNRSLWDQHQVLVYGYEEHDPITGRLYVYDPNAPHQYAATDDLGNPHFSVITLGFGGSALSGNSPSDTIDPVTNAKLDTLAGFFCSNYLSKLPPRGLATSYGQFLRWTGDSRTWMVTDGARMPVSGSAELTALGATATDVRATGGVAPPGSVRPRNGSLLRERSAAPVYLYVGGAPFQIPDPMWLDRFGGWDAVRTVPDGTLNTFVGLPDEGTLLREWSDPKIYLIKSGQRRWVSTQAELTKHGGMPTVRAVPDGALAPIPRGPDLPPQGPTTIVPDVREMPKAIATTAVLNADLIPRFTGSNGPNAWVRTQSPGGGSRAERGSTVTMQLSIGRPP